MKKLRTVEFWKCDRKVKSKGFFHSWGQRQDENLTEFFGVVEDELGACFELDPIQIRFTDNHRVDRAETEVPCTLCGRENSGFVCAECASKPPGNSL
jgi:hypothetical protein